MPQALLVDGQGPKFEVLNETTVRYTWHEPNPMFLPALAGPSPLYIYRPAHYLRQFHARYVGARKGQRARDRGRLAQLGGPAPEEGRAVPVRQPGPADARAVDEHDAAAVDAVRARAQPVFPPRRQHRDGSFRTSTAIIVGITDDKLIPAKTGAGDVDLQVRYLRFDNYTFLKQGEKRNQYHVRLWEKALGSQIALYPNLNAEDPEWRKLMRDVRFRRALSLGINRHEVNEVVYFGLGRESSNTVLQRSPLFRPEFRTAWTKFDVKAANALLDAIGLTQARRQRACACCRTAGRWSSSSTRRARAPRRPTCSS